MKQIVGIEELHHKDLLVLVLYLVLGAPFTRCIANIGLDCVIHATGCHFVAYPAASEALRSSHSERSMFAGNVLCPNHVVRIEPHSN